MNKKTILIDQTLHGYNHGHQLLGSSLDMSIDSQQIMLRVSDLSGQNIQTGFSKYYTGYFLAEINKAVISCTWYADEMKRPGCVWTHSLILNTEELSYIASDIIGFVKLFSRPVDSVSRYTNKISFEVSKKGSELEGLNLQRIEYVIWSLWGHAKPLIIPNNNSQEYFEEILYLWSKFNKYIPCGFAFSTGSLSTRRINDRIFNLQIMPENVIGSRNMDSEYDILPKQTDINSFPVWVQKSLDYLKKDNWESFGEFLELFDIKTFTPEKFNLLIKLFIGAEAENHCINIIGGLKIIEKIFEKEDRQYYGCKLIDLFINDEFNVWFPKYSALNLLLHLFELKWLEISNEQLVKLIHKSYQDSKNEIKLVIKKIAQKESYNKTELILKTYSELITHEEFLDITDLDLNLCCILIAFHFEFALCSEIWNQSEYFQKEILLTLKNSNLNQSDLHEIIQVIYSNSKYDFAIDLYESFGNECISIFFNMLLSNKMLKKAQKNSIEKICILNQNICIATLNEIYVNLGDTEILLIMDILLPYANDICKIEYKRWVDFFNILSKSNLFEDNKLKIAWFYFSIILKYNEKFPLNIASFTFSIVHESLENQKSPNKEWYKIEPLLPNIAFFNQWDRCKRVRKAFRQKGYNLTELEKYDKEL